VQEGDWETQKKMEIVTVRIVRIVVGKMETWESQWYGSSPSVKA
jgi:hypothetical protein